MLRMDEIKKIKKAHNVQEKSKYEISNQFNRSWATVDRYVKATTEEIRKVNIVIR